MLLGQTQTEVQLWGTATTEQPEGQLSASAPGPGQGIEEQVPTQPPPLHVVLSPEPFCTRQIAASAQSSLLVHVCGHDDPQLGTQMPGLMAETTLSGHCDVEPKSQ